MSLSTRPSASSAAKAPDGIISEAVRRARAMPQFADAHPDELRMRLTETFASGITTMYGLLRSLRDNP